MITDDFRNILSSPRLLILGSYFFKNKYHYGINCSMWEWDSVRRLYSNAIIQTEV